MVRQNGEAMTIPRSTLGLLLLLPLTLFGEPLFFAGVGGGISTLSGDAAASFNGSANATSQYKPKNGPLLSAFGGAHLNDWFSVEASYVWNRNDVTLYELATPDTAFEQTRNSRQHGVFGDLLVYFRGRRSWVRPYLSVGEGVVFFRSEALDLRVLSGAPEIPPDVFTGTTAGFRSAAGIDLRLSPGLRFRYSFTETISRNEFNRRLQPSGGSRILHFQSLFAVLWESQRR